MYLSSSPRLRDLEIGVNDGQPGMRNRTLPAEVKESYVGTRVGPNVIVAIVPVGTSLKITKVFKDISGQGHLTWAECELSVDSRTYFNVSTLFVQQGMADEPPGQKKGSGCGN